MSQLNPLFISAMSGAAKIRQFTKEEISLIVESIDSLELDQKYAITTCIPLIMQRIQYNDWAIFETFQDLKFSQIAPYLADTQNPLSETQRTQWLQAMISAILYMLNEIIQNIQTGIFAVEEEITAPTEETNNTGTVE